uniref:Broad-complex core protein isoform 6 n=1 Tax=Caligus rogercresseyi TaxID=217165 RepID=C1BRP3_CALRO|nr:Broad-complex core protein isoform 6 [Caligus rogercresseyi]
MGSLDHVHFRRDNFDSYFKSGLSELRENEELFDITLASGSEQIKAHKVILSSCSQFFRSLIKSVPHQHPLLYLRGIHFGHLESILGFIYNGEASIPQEELSSFLSLAEELKIKGLGKCSSSDVSGPSREEPEKCPPSKKPRSSTNKSRKRSHPSITQQTHINARAPPPQPSNIPEDFGDISLIKQEPDFLSSYHDPYDVDPDFRTSFLEEESYFDDMEYLEEENEDYMNTTHGPSPLDVMNLSERQGSSSSSRSKSQGILIQCTPRILDGKTHTLTPMNIKNKRNCKPCYRKFSRMLGRAGA